MKKHLLKWCRYTALTKAGILQSLTFHMGLLSIFICNIIYMIIIYFLWKAIYETSSVNVVNGLTFLDTVSYLFIANALYGFMDVNYVWKMSDDIRSGAIICDMIKPLNYPIYSFFKYSGNYVVSFF